MHNMYQENMECNTNIIEFALSIIQNSQYDNKFSLKLTKIINIHFGNKVLKKKQKKNAPKTIMVPLINSHISKRKHIHS